MSEKSKLKQSRNQWKQKASERAGENRYLRKELSRVKRERDLYKEEVEDAQARASQLQAPVIEHKVDLVFLALQLFLVARIGFRAVCRVLGVMAGVLGIQKVPCPQTVINWVSRLSLVRMQSAHELRGLPRPPFSNGLIWMIDMSIGLGTGKILTVLALRAHHHQLVSAAPCFEDLHCIGVSVADSWTGETIAAFLERLIAVMGRPAAYLKDGGTDLHKANRLLGERGLSSPSIDDISHVIANLLKWWYQDHPMFETFLSACGRMSGKLKQTILACLAPPRVHTKARFMNLHRLVIWADKLLKLSPPGGAKAGSILSKLRACLDQLPSCKPFIRRFRDDALPLLECQKILKSKGLSHETMKECEQHIQAIPTVPLRRKFIIYLQGQLETAGKLGLEEIGMPISSDPLESLFGLAKLHGVGEIKDADRIALRLPALCGTPTREEAEQVLGISVAEQQEMMDRFSSLTKQRREVLSDPNRLESLIGLEAHVELTPSAGSRSNDHKIIQFPIGYDKTHGPELMLQNGEYSP